MDKWSGRTAVRPYNSFVDHARIVVRGGRGGNGCMSFRREKYVAMGGPDGGSGGRGGDIFLVADPQKKSLLDLAYKPHFYAEEGEPGQGSNKVGASAEDLRVHVPVGTLVYRADVRAHSGAPLLADLKTPGQTVLVARGGRGGRGNAAFKTHRNTAPRLSEKGEPGGEFKLELELKLLADVGLIGLPNAGKSTLLSRLTSARPKIADYPFTTLHPNLGVAEWHGVSMVFADIPGLIEGAHAGKGLGHDFLRHVERTRLLFHLVDLSGFDELASPAGWRDPYSVIKIINEELRLYSPGLMRKPMIIVANKMDVTGAGDALKVLKRKWKKSNIYPISAVTGEGLDALLAYAAAELAKPDPIEEDPTLEEPLRFVVELDFEVEREAGGFRVKGAKVERFAAMTNFQQEEGTRRFQNILKKMGVEKELLRQGVEPGDTVKVGQVEFFFEVDDEGPKRKTFKRPYRPHRR